MFDPPQESAATAERTAGDLASLLLELGRAVKGAAFYSPDDRRGAELLDRAFLAWRIELERSGPLALQIEERGFRAEESGETIENPQICELARALLTRGIRGFQFGPEMRRPLLRTFVNHLAQDPPVASSADDLERALGECEGGGIALVADVASKTEARTRIAAGRAEYRPGSHPTPASLGAALLSREHAPPLDSDAAPESEKPSLEDEPLAAPIGDARAEPLRARLRELETCADDSAYAFLAGRIVETARALFDEALSNECYRVILVLGEHAAGARGRPGLQARVAGEMLRALATGARLDDLIDRACSSEARVGIRATRLLLQLGEPAAEAIFKLLTRQENHPDRRAQLTAILITLGQAALPALTDAIEAGVGGAALLATQLAGELRNPALLTQLQGALASPRPELVHESVRSLVLIGNEDASRLLAAALDSADDELAAAAAIGLGVLQSERGLNPLLDALDAALRSGNTRRCRECIRALGQLGSEKAVPRLVSLLSRRTWLRRARGRDLKMLALAALALLPGREARRALERTARGHDRTLRARAAALLGNADVSDPAQPLQ